MERGAAETEAGDDGEEAPASGGEAAAPAEEEGEEGARGGDQGQRDRLHQHAGGPEQETRDTLQAPGVRGTTAG